MKKILVISAAVSLMSTAAFAASLGGTSSTSVAATATVKSKIVTISKPVSFVKQAQANVALADKGSSALAAGSQTAGSAAISITNTGTIK